MEEILSGFTTLSCDPSDSGNNESGHSGVESSQGKARKLSQTLQGRFSGAEWLELERTSQATLLGISLQCGI